MISILNVENSLAFFRPPGRKFDSPGTNKHLQKPRENLDSTRLVLSSQDESVKVTDCVIRNTSSPPQLMTLSKPPSGAEI